MFNKYEEFVRENGLKEKSKKSLGMTLKEHLETRAFNNKQYWIIPDKKGEQDGTIK
jgi:hypothetical protein